MPVLTWTAELVSAAYFRADLGFLSNRLKIVTGLRAEQTNIDAEGPLTDPSRNIQRDASGRPVLGANGGGAIVNVAVPYWNV